MPPSAAPRPRNGARLGCPHRPAWCAEPYRRPHEALDPTLPLGAAVIKAVNAFDDLVGESRSAQLRLDALERLRLGMAYEYDPRVVAALSRVVERAMPRAA